MDAMALHSYYIQDVITKDRAPITEAAYAHYIADDVYWHVLRTSRQTVISRRFP